MSDTATAYAIHQLWTLTQRLRTEQSAHRCKCGINLERAHCAKCHPISDEAVTHAAA